MRANIETEQDARFQVVNRVLTEVLGWPFDAIKTEPHVESGYIDYLLLDGQRCRLVVEAKREASLLVSTKLPKASSYKVGSSIDFGRRSDRAGGTVLP